MNKKNKKIIYKILEIAPFIAALAFLLCIPTLAILGQINEKVYHLIYKSAAPLHGEHTAAPRPNLSLSHFFSKKAQQNVEAWFNQGIPLKSYIVRTHNQIYYELFSKSYMNKNTVLIGTDDYLYEKYFIEAYCNPSNKQFKNEDLEKWVDNLQQISDFFEKRGKQFIYLISPSKASYFPEFLPPAYACNAVPTRPNYYLAVNELKKKDFSFVDSSELLLAAKESHPPIGFPQGGSHWTHFGAALVLQEILNKLKYKEGVPPPTIHFTYTIDNRPKGTDRDLLELANLLDVRRKYPVPVLAITNVNVNSQNAAKKLAIVGTSFIHTIGDILQQQKLFSQVDFYYYYSITHYRIIDGNKETLEATLPNTYDSLWAADIVILEETEPNIGKMMAHAEKFLKAIKEKN